MRKVKKIMSVLLMATILFTMTITPCEAKAKSNEQIAKDYCKKYCVGYQIKVVNEGKVPAKRINKNVVYIEKIKTKSKGGKRGKTTKGYFVRYIKPIKKNKKHTVYCVYNPKTNAHDDVICFVSNKKMRADKKTIKYKKSQVSKPVKVQTTSIDCEICHGEVDGCAYWYRDGDTRSVEPKHMTKEERIEFEHMEMGR